MARSASSFEAPANRLHEAIRTGGRRLDWLARKTGYSVGTISRVANRRIAPSGQFVRLTCAALDLPASYLFPEFIDEREQVAS